MAIPELNAAGLLPEGVFECTLDEISGRFGQFQGSDRRCRLFERLRDFCREAKKTGLIVAVIVDGSFVTEKERPSDVDLILVLRAGHDFAATLRPMEYNVVSRRQIRRQFGFDALIVQEGQVEFDDAVGFFSQVRSRVELRKGMLRVEL